MLKYKLYSIHVCLLYVHIVNIWKCNQWTYTIYYILVGILKQWLCPYGSLWMISESDQHPNLTPNSIKSIKGLLFVFVWPMFHHFNHYTSDPIQTDHKHQQVGRRWIQLYWKWKIPETLSINHMNLNKI